MLGFVGTFSNCKIEFSSPSVTIHSNTHRERTESEHRERAESERVEREQRGYRAEGGRERERER